MGFSIRCIHLRNQVLFSEHDHIRLKNRLDCFLKMIKSVKHSVCIGTLKYEFCKILQRKQTLGDLTRN